MPSKLDVLARIPLFSAMTPAELRGLRPKFTEQTFKKGDIVCNVGDEGDTMYIVLSGELEVWSEVSPVSGQARRLDLMEQGDFFGELALFLGGKRSAKVIASQRTTVLTLDKPTFNRYILTNNKALEYLSRVIAQRTAFAATGRSVAKTTTVISVVSRPGVVGKTLVASSLATLIRDLSKLSVLLVNAAPSSAEDAGVLLGGRLEERAIRDRLQERPEAPTLLEIEIQMSAPESAHGDRFAALVTMLSDDFEYIVLDLGCEPRELSHVVEEFSDFLIQVHGQGLPPTRESSSTMRRCDVVNLYGSQSRTPLNACDPYILPHDRTLAQLPLEAQVQRIREQPSSPMSLPLYRLARKILGRVVGIALGGGAAFGLAHIGVLKVLEENGVHVDLVAGCSMGSLIASAYSAGLGIPRMIEMAQHLGHRTELLSALDFRLQAAGVLGGSGLRECVSKYLGAKASFEDLLRPCRIIATDIHSGEQVSIGTGSLADAFRASSSVPVVWAPVEYQGRVLVDGGVSEPVPANTVREMGADIIFAVNVVPSLKKGVESSLSRNYRRLKMLNPLTYAYGSFNIPSVFDTVLNSMQTLQHELGNFKAISADVRINPDLIDFTWLDFDQADAIIARGVDAAEQALPAIRAALSKRAREFVTDR